MTPEEALRTVARYCPCPHDEYSTPLGLGDEHRCDPCGVTFDPSTPEVYAARTERFDLALAVLRTLVDGAAKERADIVTYLRSLNGYYVARDLAGDIEREQHYLKGEP